MHHFWTVFIKEIKATLRDRRSLLIMLVVPFALFPLLLSLVAGASVSQKSQALQQTLTVAIEANDNAASLVALLENRADLVVRQDIPPMYFRRLVRSDSIDVALIIDKSFDETIQAGKTGRIDLFYNATRDDAIVSRVQQSLANWKDQVLAQRLDTAGLDQAYIKPLDVQRTNVYSQKESMGKLAGGILPYMFVLFCLLGAMYPAIDLFAGEKERGSIETILTAPISRVELLLGKVAVIVVSGLVSGGLTILGLYLAITFNPNLPLELRTVVKQFLAFRPMLLVLLMMIPLTFFFAGLLVAASIYARSFKEALSYIQPMTILVFVPLIFGFMPSTELNIVTALIPVLNVALATKDVIAGTIEPLYFILTIVSLLLLALASLAFGLQWFKSEKNILRV